MNVFVSAGLSVAFLLFVLSQPTASGQHVQKIISPGRLKPNSPSFFSPIRENTDRLLCPNICLTNRRLAEIACRPFPNSSCTVVQCVLRRREIIFSREPIRGYSCSRPEEQIPRPTPSSSPAFTSPTPIPILSLGDPLNLGDILVGDRIIVRVNLTISVSSGTPMEDFYLLSDATSSIVTRIATVQERFMDVINARRTASSDVAFGVGFYRDESTEGTENGFVNVQPITTNTTSILSAINSLSAEGGGDQPEANLAALFHVATDPSIGFRDGARKIVAYFGDAPGHEPSCFDGIVATRESVSDALNAAEVTVVAAGFNGGLDISTSPFQCPDDAPPPGGSGQGTFLTTNTGGALVDIADQQGLVQVIIDAVGSLDQEINADISGCDGKFDVKFSPPMPILLPPGRTMIVEEALTILDGVCDEDPGFSCSISFTASGGVFREQVISTTATIGCRSE